MNGIYDGLGYTKFGVTKERHLFVCTENNDFLIFTQHYDINMKKDLRVI